MFNPIEIIDKFKYPGLFLLAIASIFAFWFIEKDFMFTKDPIVVEYANKELLQKSIDKYVIVENVCTFENSLFEVTNHYKKQIFASVNCSAEAVLSTCLFVALDNDKLTSIDRKIEKIEKGELLLFEGQLTRLNFTEDEFSFFKNAGINFNETESFYLISGRKPSDVLLSFYILIIGALVIAIGLSFVFYYLLDKPRQKSL